MGAWQHPAPCGGGNAYGRPALLDELAAAGADLADTGFDEDEIEELLAEANAEVETFKDKLDNSPPSSLFGTFLVPPFSVLDTRRGYWRDRKQHWLDYGIKSEVGREENLLFPKNLKIGNSDNGTSIFDPVLCEIMYRWFNVPGGLIFDPFAGGSVRGIVAKAGGFRYKGIDLRAEQVESNKENAEEVGIDTDAGGLNWFCDDSRNMDAYANAEPYYRLGGVDNPIIESRAAKDRKKAKNQNAIQDGVQALLRDRIIQAHNHYMDKEYIPVYGMENVLKMYAAYHELGGNGTATKLVDDLRELPTDKKV